MSNCNNGLQDYAQIIRLLEAPKHLPSPQDLLTKNEMNIKQICKPTNGFINDKIQSLKP